MDFGLEGDFSSQAGYLDRGEQFLPAHTVLGSQVTGSAASRTTEDCEGSMFAAPQPLTLLVTGDEDGTLILSVSGLFPVARLQLVGPAAAAVACCTSGNLRTLHVWLQTVDGPKLDTYDLEFLETRQREVCSISILSSMPF